MVATIKGHTHQSIIDQAVTLPFEGLATMPKDKSRKLHALCGMRESGYHLLADGRLLTLWLSFSGKGIVTLDQKADYALVALVELSPLQ